MRPEIVRGRPVWVAEVTEPSRGGLIMGMDVYGKKPTAPEGEYFRNNVWSWRPLADYVLSTAPRDLTDRCAYWHSNDGAGLDAEDSVRLADILQAEIDAGRTATYERVYASNQERTPNVPCNICAGTGRRLPIPERGAGDVATGIKCNGCGGEGTVRPYSTMYPFSEENIVNFVRFLRACGGFDIC